MWRLAFPVLWCILLPGLLAAGQVYGSITHAGKGLANEAIAIDCGGTVTKGTTAADGGYRIQVPQEGRCSLTLPGRGGASAAVFSYPKPAQYDFELVQQNGRYTLNRR